MATKQNTVQQVQTCKRSTKEVKAIFSTKDCCIVRQYGAPPCNGVQTPKDTIGWLLTYPNDAWRNAFRSAATAPRNLPSSSRLTVSQSRLTVDSLRAVATKCGAALRWQQRQRRSRGPCSRRGEGGPAVPNRDPIRCTSTQMGRNHIPFCHWA